MKKECFDCGGTMEKRSQYTVDDPYVGRITVEGDYWHCPECGEDEVPYETMKTVEDERRRIVEELLWKSLKGTESFDQDYMLTHELADFLGISRQAVTQSKVIADSIFNITIKKSRYWLRKSAELYKATGDGWFPLVSQTDETRLSFKDIAQENFDGVEDYVSRLTSQPTSENSISYIATSNTRKTTGGTCSSRKTSSRPQGRKFSHNRQQPRSLFIFSTSQETQKTQYLKYQPATSSPATM